MKYVLAPLLQILDKDIAKNILFFFIFFFFSRLFLYAFRKTGFYLRKKKHGNVLWSSIPIARRLDYVKRPGSTD